MINLLLYYSQQIISKGRKKRFNVNIQQNIYLQHKKYGGIELLDINQAHRKIFEKISSKEPFMLARFGGNELHAMAVFEHKIYKKQDNSLYLMCNNAGFFPSEKSHLNEFVTLMKQSCKSVDLLGVWNLPFEEYYIKKSMNKNLSLCALRYIEPWGSEVPWTKALKDKKVLVIHPFVETIKRQYAKRELLFDNKDMLPNFELDTLKAVQTIAGEKDERFETWFDALEWMFEEAMKRDFDVAIIGCGAYGFPLSAKLKEVGKQAIHLGGVTQMLFGIKGSRWDNHPNPIFRSLYNEYWVYPDESEKPQNSSNIEGGCYW